MQNIDVCACVVSVHIRVSNAHTHMDVAIVYHDFIISPVENLSFCVFVLRFLVGHAVCLVGCKHCAEHEQPSGFQYIASLINKHVRQI